MADKLHSFVYRFVAEAGNLTQSIGLGRVVGQIYAYLYLSEAPKNLNDMCRTLKISKGSASTLVRQLEQWGAVKKVWVVGDRKDYYAANDWFGGIARSLIRDVLGKRVAQSNGVVDEDFGVALRDMDPAQRDFVTARMGQLRGFRDKLKAALSNPFVQAMLE